MRMQCGKNAVAGFPDAPAARPGPANIISSRRVLHAGVICGRSPMFKRYGERIK